MGEKQPAPYIAPKPPINPAREALDAVILANREYARKVAEAEMARHALSDAVTRAQAQGLAFRDIETAIKNGS